MITTRSFLALVGLTLLGGSAAALLASSSVEASEADEKAAVPVAEAWLKLVDGGDYGASWREAASLFKNAVTEAKWKEAAGAARKPLGKVLSRRVKSTTFAKELPGAPDGSYVVIQFETSFENKKSAIETITPMLDKDGRWRVSGYFVK